MYVYLFEEWIGDSYEVNYVFLIRKHAEKKLFKLLEKYPYREYLIVKKRLLI